MTSRLNHGPCCKLLVLLLCRQLLVSLAWVLGGGGVITRQTPRPALLWKRLPFAATTKISGQRTFFQGRGAHGKLTMMASDRNDAATLTAEKTHETDRHDHEADHSSSSRSYTLSPLQILHPILAAPANRTTPVSLFQALRYMRQACQAIVDGTNREADWKAILLDDESGIYRDDSSIMIRLQIPISHPVDPLAWLHAQSQDLPLRQPPVEAFYLQTEAQQSQSNGHYHHDGGSDAVATLFSAKTYRTTVDALQAVETVLPDQARLYGGARFDANTTFMSDEWKDFGEALWILPGIELRVSHNSNDSTRQTTTLAMHLVANNANEALRLAAQQTLNRLAIVSDAHSPAMPCTTLPPILSRESNYYTNTNSNSDNANVKNGSAAAVMIDGQELFEKGLEQALLRINNSQLNITSGVNESRQLLPPLNKVVLARKQTLHFATMGQDDWTGLEVIRRWNYGGHEGGHLFYLRVGSGDEFFGCTPERLFRVYMAGNETDGSNSNVRQTAWLQSEALAGTRPRGSSPQADEDLLQELVTSPKDRSENTLTGQYIQERFDALERKSYIMQQQQDGTKSRFFVRRLLHLQHICQQFSARLVKPEHSIEVTRHLLQSLHPTPAVCGVPVDSAMEFVRQYESTGFDRGFYSGPVGYMGKDATDILVAIRSGHATKKEDTGQLNINVYAGVGLVAGSTLSEEWAETNYKLAVLSSMFPQSPLTLKGAVNVNVAWSTAFIEELIRNGVTQFYVCPGSRSTPLVVAIARSLRMHVGVVHAESVHDERAAAFRALGYARGCGRPAAVITSSGTAVANLYPAIVEAGMDGIPMVVLTADRPYESRNTGANQAIDQVKMFSSTYTRWFRDVLPPDDRIPVSVALSDAAHAVNVAKQSLGPVHVNIQFRENLAPDGGPLRNDNRAGAVAKYDGNHFTDVSGFRRWSTSGDRWTKLSVANAVNNRIVDEVARLISLSKRGIIVVGNLRSDASGASHLVLLDLVASLAQSIGFPVLAGAQSAALRFRSHAVVPFAEHLLKCPEVGDNLQPDLVIQLGAPLLSTAIPSLIESAMKNSERTMNHVLIHPRFSAERTDPSFTVTHDIKSDIAPFVQSLVARLDEAISSENQSLGSELAPLVLLGRRLQEVMKPIIGDASAAVATRTGQQIFTEPEIVVALAEAFTVEDSKMRSLFVSNSMPVRDCESFLYPFDTKFVHSTGPMDVGTNRGASGIDGIISSAHGFAESKNSPTTLLIGDLATLYDLTSMHALSGGGSSKNPGGMPRHPLTTIIVNNGGGGIFSFLPIAKHGPDVSFNEYFSTPTSSFSYGQGTSAFGLDVNTVDSLESFEEEYNKATRSHFHRVIEAIVAPHEFNVAVHQEITKGVMSFVSDFLRAEDFPNIVEQRLSVDVYQGSLHTDTTANDEVSKTLVLLHGWMGDKVDWAEVASLLSKRYSPADWNIVVVDLPGHGRSPFIYSGDHRIVRSALRMEGLDDPQRVAPTLSVDMIAVNVLKSLSKHHGIKQIHAIAGYSLGGRVALAMKHLSEYPPIDVDIPILLRPNAKVMLFSAFPGKLFTETYSSCRPIDLDRFKADNNLAQHINRIGNHALLNSPKSNDGRYQWSSFLTSWYGAPLWGNLIKRPLFHSKICKRSAALTLRSRDIAAILRDCSPAINDRDHWKACVPQHTLFVAGRHDRKYATIGQAWSSYAGITYREVENAGHALLSEAPSTISEIIYDFLCGVTFDGDDAVGMNSISIPTPTVVAASVDDTDYDETNDGESVSQIDATLRGNVGLLANGRQTGTTGSFARLSFEAFSVDFIDANDPKSGVIGIGWGEEATASRLASNLRQGLLIEIASHDGLELGLGEVSPLKGLHSESLDEARDQLELIQSAMEGNAATAPTFEASAVVALNGALQEYLLRLALFVNIKRFHQSVYSGLEMAVLSLASQRLGLPLHRLLLGNIHRQKLKLLPINGLVLRGRQLNSLAGETHVFQSVKVKVGHQSLDNDLQAMANAYRRTEKFLSNSQREVRADANRAWSESEAIEFASSLSGVVLHALERTEFIEEPLKLETVHADWVEAHIKALERWYRHTGFNYALDETIADIVQECEYDFGQIESILSAIFADGPRGCAAFVLKPALLGLEMSLRVASLARLKLGIAAVFSSSFESGVGLAYTSLLAAASDEIISSTPCFPHGIGTFTSLSGDTLNPAFSFYVNDEGMLSVPSLSRAMYGLCLDDLSDSLSQQPFRDVAVATKAASPDYEASTSSSSRGSQISVVVSLPLPFSAQTATARFTDLPQQSRWSPWISSVSYQGEETMWTLNVKGIPLTWRAKSQLMIDPPGIEWESVSGLKNRGMVEFLPTSENECTMNVQMTLLTPRLLRPLFRGTSLFLEEFLRDKLLRWSLEMFRDVVKADLALERGNVELGDALYSAVEGRACAIEATLNAGDTRQLPVDDQRRYGIDDESQME